jgi:DNA-binding response OmpR family regulator
VTHVLTGPIFGRVSADNPRVLVADDDPTIILLLEHVLDGLGWQHDAVDDGTAAWDAWEKTRHSLVILDIDMPGMDGLRVCRRIREAEPGRETFILVVTGHDKAADLESVLAAGADDYVSKPTTGQRLTARLRIAQRHMENDASRREVEEELRKSRWLAGVGEATVSLQHEINNPLAGLLGIAELMQIEAREAGRSTEEIDLMIVQARRIQELVRKLGDLRDPTSVDYAAGTPSRMVDLQKKR